MWNRRHFVAVCAGVGLGGTVMPGVLLTLAQDQPRITKDMIDTAAKIADVTIPDEFKDAMLQRLNDAEQGYEAVYKLHMPNSVQPAIVFDPLPMGAKVSTAKAEMVISAAPAVATKAPKNIEECAFMTVRQLAALLSSKQVSSMSLTEMYLERLKRYNSKLLFYVNLTEDRAKTQAAAADKEIAAGKYRGPLHGIPWGAKDLLAVKGYPTTWGAGGFEHQMLDEDATVVQRRASGQADRRCAGLWRFLVRRPDAQSMATSTRLQRFQRRTGFGHFSRLRRLRHRHGNARLDFFSRHALRRHRFAAHIRICPAHRRDGAFLDDRQGRAHLPLRGRLRDRNELHSRAGRQGPQRAVRRI
jgi:Amidase